MKLMQLKKKRHEKSATKEKFARRKRYAPSSDMEKMVRRKRYSLDPEKEEKKRYVSFLKKRRQQRE